MAVVGVQRFEVRLTNLDLTQGSEVNRTRPCVVLSPDEMNRPLRLVTIAALTSTRRDYPSRVDCTFQDKEGQVALDHLRLVDKTCLVRRLEILPSATAQEMCDRLQELFQYYRRPVPGLPNAGPMADFAHLIPGARPRFPPPKRPLRRSAGRAASTCWRRKRRRTPTTSRMLTAWPCTRGR
ncbi:type II toxin-antitoxin system PemK/MazF family toxin [Hymenobacter humi]|uniref:Type II toxin-antitoxin system PemK/MazF family toxin n=1 Tax=Hymenobacter humi TaxID=1411620 RepID=A0ABW2UCE5_9BACT